jgi:endonuclease YncB( thermonuclease family)
MQFLLALVFAMVAGMQLPGTLQRSDSLLVRRVIDGDTIDVSTVGRVGLLGVTAPFGIEARDRLASLVSGRWVRLEYDPSAPGSHRRAYVMRDDGVFVNAALARDGLVRVSAGRPLSRTDELRRAEREAQALHLGMWSQLRTPPRPR